MSQKCYIKHLQWMTGWGELHYYKSVDVLFVCRVMGVKHFYCFRETANVHPRYDTTVYGLVTFVHRAKWVGIWQWVEVEVKVWFFLSCSDHSELWLPGKVFVLQSVRRLFHTLCLSALKASSLLLFHLSGHCFLRRGTQDISCALTTEPLPVKEQKTVSLWDHFTAASNTLTAICVVSESTSCKYHIPCATFGFCFPLLTHQAQTAKQLGVVDIQRILVVTVGVVVGQARCPEDRHCWSLWPGRNAHVKVDYNGK